MSKIKINLFGLEGVGKTTFLYKLKLGEVITTIPTIGFNVETIEYMNNTFDLWDVGGKVQIRPLWRHYYADTHGIIFMVDANDRENIEEAREALQQILAEEELKDTVLLIVSNKIDIPGAMTVPEVTDRLGLQSLKDRNWHIQATSLINGEGVSEGLDWLVAQFAGKFILTET